MLQELYCVLRTGEELLRFVEPVKDWDKRECFGRLKDYVYGNVDGRVFVLCGLRRTGKTTLIRQLIAEMNTEMQSKSVFIQIQDGRTLAEVNHDLTQLEAMGYRYVFIDEVTLLDDFIEGAALFSDVFAASGMRIVLSGTDSLGFLFTEKEELYDRCIVEHTTFIPYREFEYVLGVFGIDEYIRYGGTMSLGAMIFSTKKSTDEYVDSAIARNIQHALKNYQDGSHFRSLGELYERNELTSVINRIVEDINHRFTLEILTKNFKSHDLRVSARNLEQSVRIEDVHRKEIKEYLDLLDLTVEIETRWMTDYNKKESRTVFSQPGMRYSQAEALIKSLLQDEKFRALSLAERTRVTERILDEVKGRMMEDIVLLETKLARMGCEVFRLQFVVGEFDMVVFDPENGNCRVYEIKHSAEAVPEQCRHLLDESKCVETEFRYGPIEGKYVIYRGEPKEVGDVTYLNVEEYLRKLGR